MNLPRILRNPAPQSGTPSMSENNTNTRLEPKAPAPMAPPISGQAYAPPRYRSQAYAQAQAEWEQLDNELAYTKDQCESLRAQIKVVEETIKALKIERDELRSSNERLVRENTDMHASVTAAANCLVGLVAKRSNGNSDDPRLDARDAIEAALTATSTGALHHGN